MRKLKCRFPVPCLLILTLFLLSCEKEELDQPTEAGIKACSFNIRFDNPEDGFNRWENRRKEVVVFLGIEQPDVIGFQEVLAPQLEYLEMRLTGYASVGVGRDDGVSEGEFAPVFYRENRFRLADSGTFWLSETPDVPSKGWGAVIPRICTFVHLNDLETGEELHIYNTHFSHVSSVAQLESARLIMATIARESEGAHVILTGDLNAEPGSDPYTEITALGMTDSFESDVRLGPAGTYNGFRLTGSHDRRIDYIFIRGFVPEYYLTSSMVIDNRYLSDHFPVITMLNYE